METEVDPHLSHDAVAGLQASALRHEHAHAPQAGVHDLLPCRALVQGWTHLGQQHVQAVTSVGFGLCTCAGNPMQCPCQADSGRSWGLLLQPQQARSINHLQLTRVTSVPQQDNSLQIARILAMQQLLMQDAAHPAPGRPPCLLSETAMQTSTTAMRYLCRNYHEQWQD